MNKYANRGLFAEKTLDALRQEELSSQSLSGATIEAMDFFEREKLSLIQEFNALKIQDDIFVLQHRDNLV